MASSLVPSPEPRAHRYDREAAAALLWAALILAALATLVGASIWALHPEQIQTQNVVDSETLPDG